MCLRERDRLLRRLPRHLREVRKDFLMDRELPWHLTETETWTELIAPYLLGQIELQIQELCTATTGDHRAVIQGRIQALKALQDAPDVYARIQSLNQQMKEREEKLADGPRERRGRVSRPVKRTR